MVSFEAPEYCELHAAFWLFLYFDLQIVTSGTKYSTPSKKKIERKKLFRKANKITQTFNWIILWHLYAYDVHRRHSKKADFFLQFFNDTFWNERSALFTFWIFFRREKCFEPSFFIFLLRSVSVLCTCNKNMQTTASRKQKKPAKNKNKMQQKRGELTLCAGNEYEHN